MGNEVYVVMVAALIVLISSVFLNDMSNNITTLRSVSNETITLIDGDTNGTANTLGHYPVEPNSETITAYCGG